MTTGEWMARYRASVGNLLLAVILILSRPDVITITCGFFFMLSGTIFRAWASGYLDKEHRLSRAGPFSLTRNPHYFGNLLIGLGVAVAGNHYSSYLIFVLYFLAFYPGLMIREHRRLSERYGREYTDWAKKTNAFIPGLKRVVPGEFNISLYMRNREYRVIYFFLLLTALFVFKFLYTMSVD